MFLRILYSIVVWIVVALVLSLFGSLLLTFSEEVIVKIGQFLKDSAVIIGFLCGLCYLAFGGNYPTLRR